MKKIIILLCGLFTTLVGYTQKIETERIKKHITYLASDKLEGRFPGSKGEKKASKYIIRQFEKAGLQPMGTLYFYQEFPMSYNPNPHDTSSKGAIKTKGQNIIGYLNNDAEYTIAIGAHYDHLGRGHAGNSMDKTAENQIHNGADDNASGTAGVIELARHFAKNNRKEPCNLLFICFSGEEEGLLGSKYFTNNPTYPLEKISCMINMDMIGRLSDSTHKLMVSGTGTAAIWEPLLNQLIADHTYLKLKTDSAGMGPSDHASFYLKNIPVLHFFSGLHTDYHKPSDDANKINYYGEKQILDFIVKVINETAKEPKPAFLPTRNPQTERVAFKVTLGIVPDYSFEGPGLRMDGVSPDKPAQKAGLQAGDILIGINELVISDMKSYMQSLAGFKKGQTVTLYYLRNGKKESTQATF
jgi:hypothetical protein